MAELSVSETTTFRWSLEEDAAEYAAAGVRAVGVWRRKLADCGLPKAVEAFQRGGLKVSHLFWAGGFTGGDGRSHRESVDDAAEAVRAAARLHCPTLTLCTGPRAGHTANHARRLLQAALAELAPLAAASGVALALEPMHPACAAEWTFLVSLDETLEVLRSVADLNVKMVFDAYHLGWEPDVAARLGDAVPYIALVQLGDGRRPPDGEPNRCRLGAGAVPLAEIVAALHNGGYNGYYDVELMGEEIEADDYRALLRHAKAMFEMYDVGGRT